MKEKIEKIVNFLSRDIILFWVCIVCLPISLIMNDKNTTIICLLCFLYLLLKSIFHDRKSR